MKIVGLKVQNIQRVEVVEIRPEGNVVVIGGRNGQGKSSTLDAIFMALAGKRAQSDMPVRQGAASGTITVELDDDINIKKTIYPSGDEKIEVTSKDGKKYNSPQKLLDSLLSRFKDPLEFKNLPAIKQQELLKELLGLDFTELDSKRSEFLADRTAFNRELATQQATLSGMPRYDGVPLEPIPTESLTAQIKEIEVVQNQRQQKLTTITALNTQIQNTDVELQRLREQFDATVQRREHLIGQLQDTEQSLKAMEAPDTSDIMRAVTEATETNKKIAANLELNKMIRASEDTGNAIKELNAEIEKIDDEKKRRISAVNFPVVGLGFGDNGITYNSIPFSQISSAEQLKVSVAIGLAMSPTLRVLLIRNGAMLDEENLKLLCQMAEENDAQLWIERVGEGEEMTVVIEDGKVKEANGRAQNNTSSDLGNHVVV